MIIDIMNFIKNIVAIPNQILYCQKKAHKDFVLVLLYSCSRIKLKYSDFLLKKEFFATFNMNIGIKKRMDIYKITQRYVSDFSGGKDVQLRH